MLGRSEKEFENFQEALPKFQEMRRLVDGEFEILDRIGRLIDQKATSMLTYLAVLVAGGSIMFVSEDESHLAVGLAFMVLFGMVFAAAFLCLSVTSITTTSGVFKGRTPEQSRDFATRVVCAREARFNLAYRLTVLASGLFAVLIFMRVFAQYFL